MGLFAKSDWEKQQAEVARQLEVSKSNQAEASSVISTSKARQHEAAEIVERSRQQLGVQWTPDARLACVSGVTVPAPLTPVVE